jgi:5-methylcytosine-specific restriction endonuclease McrA
MSSCEFCDKNFNSNNSMLNHQHRCSLNPSPKGNKFTKESAKTASSGKNYGALVEFNNVRRFKDSEVFVENSTYARHNIKRRIVESGIIEYRCSKCSNDGNHNGKPLVLQLDHINGVNNDHRLENLRFLCPNCHTQEDTYAAKNIVKKKVSQ